VGLEQEGPEGVKRGLEGDGERAEPREEGREASDSEATRSLPVEREPSPDVDGGGRAERHRHPGIEPPGSGEARLDPVH